MCSPTRPSAQQANELSTKNPRSCVRVVYIAGDTLRHQPMGADHMTVLHLHGPMAFRVLQWCHPMLASTTRTSCCTRIITLYGMRKWIQASASIGFLCEGSPVLLAPSELAADVANRVLFFLALVILKLLCQYPCPSNSACVCK